MIDRKDEINNKQIETIGDYGIRVSNCLKTIDQKLINKLHKEIFTRINSSSTIYFIGNGGSHANAHHIVGDYLKTFSFEGIRLNVNCMADNACFLTAASNDYNYDEVYAVLVGTIINKDDLIVYLSGSGNSMNLIKCANKAKEFGIKQVSVTAYNGGQLKNIVNIPIYIECYDMEVAEDCQISIFHNIKQRLMNDLTKNKSHKTNMTKYIKRTIDNLIA